MLAVLFRSEIRPIHIGAGAWQSLDKAGICFNETHAVDHGALEEINLHAN